MTSLYAREPLIPAISARPIDVGASGGCPYIHLDYIRKNMPLHPLIRKWRFVFTSVISPSKLSIIPCAIRSYIALSAFLFFNRFS
jgi:hypothetical protein